ncbi:hypothetical protein [Psychrobacter sp. 72-O-c]|uniref:hypothetical protein n=1 Tax=Psychrobacter sp. 72-O-c TaxID=2774125 RepID=UPI001919B1BE|nr:hypothetical protein [Psychrobacter sp. 72-O-c]
MPLRPIDAIFFHPERRLYVVYYRGELWQLPRMKIDDTSWQRRRPYNGAMNALYLSSHQAINDPVLAQKLRTLNLPHALRGCTLLRFEAWWETHGFEWLKDQLTTGQSPLAAHAKTADNQSTSSLSHKPDQPNSATDTNTANHTSNDQKTAQAPSTDIFADMLADLADEVMHQHL